MKKRYGGELSPSLEVCALWQDTIQLLVDAIRRANTTDPEAIRSALEKTSDFRGLVASYSYGPGRQDAMQQSGLTIAYATGVEDHIKTRIPDAP